MKLVLDSITQLPNGSSLRNFLRQRSPSTRLFVEELPDMSEPKKITIITDGISEQQKNTDKFKSAYKEMLAQLTAPGFAPVLCAHEAAHAVFFTIAGMKEFEARPASLMYDPKIDDYCGNLAAIQVLDLPSWKQGEFLEWFTKIACAHAAGGVVARKLMPTTDGGDQDDRDRFKEVCDELNKDPNVKIDFEQWWKHAQETVAKILEEHPELMAAIEQEAAKLREQFGL